MVTTESPATAETTDPATTEDGATPQQETAAAEAIRQAIESPTAEEAIASNNIDAIRALMRASNDVLVQSKKQTQWTGFDDEEGAESAPAEETPAAEETDTTTAAATPGETTETEAAATPTPEEQAAAAKPAVPKKDPNRVRINRFADTDRAVILRATEKGITLDEARAELQTEGKVTTAVKSEERRAESSPNSQLPATNSEITTQQGVIAALETQIEEAGAAFDTTRLAKLNIEHNKALNTLNKLEAKAENERSRTQAQEQTRTQTETATAEQSAIKMFPDAGVEGTALYEAIEDWMDDPANAEAMTRPKWPIIAAAESAEKIGYKPAAAAAPAPKAQAPNVVPKKPARPVPPGPASGNAAPATATPRGPNLEQQISDATAAGDVTKLRQLLRENGTRSLD